VAVVMEQAGTLRPPSPEELEAFPSIPGLDDPPLESPLRISAARLLPPVIPRKICAIGRNYAAHAAELGNEVPSRPLLFHKPATAVIGEGEAIRLPPDSARVEHEVELAVVIGRRCRHVAPEDFAAVVAGYTVLNDVTARDLQRADRQFARGKGFDTFCPLGPWLVTALDPSDLEVRCLVDGELRQSGRTSQMIFDVPTLVAAVSRIMTLEPGDIIATGTPQGVGELVDGSSVACTIEGIGTLTNPVCADVDVPPMPPPIS
jgi:2-keto-4-pentenoate hydratase/2-oxohepta-3-ene-1,7-dioic acid hydratase in catechol pathway